MKNWEPHRLKPQQNTFLFRPLHLLMLFFLHRQKLICHWILKVIVFSFGPSSMCTFHFSHKNKVRLKLHRGDISIFNPSEVEASYGRRRAVGGRGEKTQYRETGSISDGKTTLMGNRSLLKSQMYNISTGMSDCPCSENIQKWYNFSSFTTMFITAISDGSSWLLDVDTQYGNHGYSCGRTDLKWKRWHHK